MVAPGSPIASAAGANAASFQVTGEPSPFEEESEAPPLPGVLEELPAEEPVLAPAIEDGPDPDLPGGYGSSAISDYDTVSSCGKASRPCCRRSCRRCARGLDITFGGWLAQGFTWNSDSPDDRFNGTVTFNDRSNEYQLNQFWLYMEREADTGGHGLAFGGRVDFMYGTDWRFTSTAGLDDGWNGSERFYGAALPQMYVDAAWNDLTVRMGHFFTIIGYEVVQAPENFFYSHSYSMQYGEPFTHTGLLAIYDVNDQVSISGGFHRGWDNWEDNNDNLGFLGGISWTSPDRKSAMTFALTTSEEDNDCEDTRTMYSLILSRQITPRLQYVLQHDWGCQQAVRPGENGTWFGFNNYLFYEINSQWSAGLRYEWFSDDDATRVGMVPPNWQDTVPANWQELTVGLRWTPRSNVIVRTEFRWDCVDPLVLAPGGPFDDLGQRDQRLWGTDLIITFQAHQAAGRPAVAILISQATNPPPFEAPPVPAHGHRRCLLALGSRRWYTELPLRSGVEGTGRTAGLVLDGKEKSR